MLFRIPINPFQSEFIATTEELRQRLIERAKISQHLSFSYRKSTGDEVNEFVEYHPQQDVLIDTKKGEPINWRELQKKASGQYYG